MDMIFDTATGQLTIDPQSIQPHGADLRAMLNRHGQPSPIRHGHGRTGGGLRLLTRRKKAIGNGTRTQGRGYLCRMMRT